uniref:Transposase Tc1-like domain-containing protein n=1 Tax=Sinocyclocheilus anshuiensis TaxID=1608454 RepID=A0A671QL42_9TELE
IQSDLQMRTIKAVKTNKRILLAFLTLVNISVHEFIIRKTLRKPQLSKQNTTACLRFAKLHLDDPCGYWKNVIH